MSTSTIDDEVNDAKCTPSFFNFFNIGISDKCKEYNRNKKNVSINTEAAPAPEPKAPEPKAPEPETKAPEPEQKAPESEPNAPPGGTEASGRPAGAATLGGWFSKGSKRKSKAKKSRHKNRKQRKSRKSRK
jgi:hypothetical protein